MHKGTVLLIFKGKLFVMQFDVITRVQSKTALGIQTDMLSTHVLTQ